MKFYHFPNIGFLEEELSKESIKKLNKYIKDSYKKVNYDLAGNITKSNELIDKDNWFFNNVLIPLIKQYGEENINAIVPSALTRDCPYVLNTMWVNYQNKYEFNPTHDHTGIFSFVVWIKIPSSYKKEKQLKFLKESNSPCSNTFEFIYTNILGTTCSERYYLEPEDEGTILLFPAKLMHQVYPFYLSNKQRISVSGNVALDPTKTI